uniref:Metallo-beta-lactamase domain-containing protein n=1 Tax=Panagrolaimus sp. PS1159 TaxID=55785 RepID=A0AC35GE86_9BILA
MVAHRIFVFRQLFEPVSCTYSYILGCSSSKKAVIIDPVFEMIERDTKLILQMGLDLIYGINTHIHADHITATGELKKRFPSMHSILNKKAEGKADVLVENNDVIHFGKESLEVRATPGHTSGCTTFISHDRRLAFTGDTLLIRGCGRTDFQGGSAKTLYESIHNQIFTLPDDYLLYPGHDYSGQTVTTVGEEKQFNLRLNSGEKHFINIMENLKLPHPRLIERAVPANKVCGVFELMDEKLKNEISSQVKSA